MPGRIDFALRERRQMERNVARAPVLGGTNEENRSWQTSQLRFNEQAIRNAQTLISESAFLCGVSKELIGTSHELMEDCDLADRTIRSREMPRAQTWVNALRLIAVKSKERALATILDLALDITDAEFGNLQVFD